MGAEPLVQPLVASLAREIEVELAEGVAHLDSSNRSSPAVGIGTQPGRLPSS